MIITDIHLKVNSHDTLYTDLYSNPRQSFNASSFLKDPPVISVEPADKHPKCPNPGCGCQMVPRGTYCRECYVYANRFITDPSRVYDIEVLNSSDRIGLDWYRDENEKIYDDNGNELGLLICPENVQAICVIMRIHEFFCPACAAKEREREPEPHKQTFIHSAFPDWMAAFCKYSVKVMCDIACGVLRDPDLDMTMAAAKHTLNHLAQYRLLEAKMTFCADIQTEWHSNYNDITRIKYGITTRLRYFPKITHTRVRLNE